MSTHIKASSNPVRDTAKKFLLDYAHFEQKMTKKLPVKEGEKEWASLNFRLEGLRFGLFFDEETTFKPNQLEACAKGLVHISTLSSFNPKNLEKSGFPVWVGNRRLMMSALERAAYERNTRVAQALLEAGVDVNARTEDGRGALRCAFMEYLLRSSQLSEPAPSDMLRLLLKAGALPNPTWQKDGMNLLKKTDENKEWGPLFSANIQSLWDARCLQAEVLALQGACSEREPQKSGSFSL